LNRGQPGGRNNIILDVTKEFKGWPIPIVRALNKGHSGSIFVQIGEENRRRGWNLSTTTEFDFQPSGKSPTEKFLERISKTADID
jgi:hypothetical protein